MPELPEVETIVRNLTPKLAGLNILFAELLYPPLLRNGKESSLRKLKERKILGVHRRGKLILVDCENDLTLLFHLKMTGNLLFCDKRTPSDKHTHFILTFRDQDEQLRFRDVRKFGYLSLIRTSEAFSSEGLRKLGPEALEIDFASFLELFRGRKARIKNLLLNQNFIAGIGNIYANEILFQAKIHPLRSASHFNEKEIRKLWTAMRNVLREAIEKKGSSVRNYTDTNGRKGSFQDYLQVYRRDSLPCLRCGEGIRRLRQAGRSSFFCPKCQSIEE